MSRPQPAVTYRAPLTYRAVLTLPGALRSFTAASLGRLAYGTIGLSLLLVVHQATGSFAAAGTASGCYAAGTLTGPAKSRLADRYGQRRILPVLAAGSAAALLTMAVLDRAGDRNPAGYIVLAGWAGAMGPMLAPDLLVLGIVMALTGTAIAPALVLSYLSADRLNDQPGGSEAGSWVSTAANAGTAAGYGLTGLAVDRVGSAPPMLAGAVVLLSAIVIVMIFRAAYDQDACRLRPGRRHREPPLKP